jgi:hypothetical protein
MRVMKWVLSDSDTFLLDIKQEAKKNSSKSNHPLSGVNMHCYRTLLPISLYENMVRNISVKELDIKVSDVAGHLIRTLHFPSNLMSNLL